MHLLIDACYAEDVVRPRDGRAKVVDVDNQELLRLTRASTLVGFPNVGAVLASATERQTHEWDLYRQGVFTHQVLSGLRGAADVNGDDRLEYSELAAFLASINRQVDDPRAQMQFVVHPPEGDRHAPIVDLASATGIRLRGVPAIARHLYVEDRSGSRLVELRAEPKYAFSLLLPADESLYLVSDDQSFEFSGRAGEVVSLSKVLGERPPFSRRGALGSALKRGLFITPFGPGYYRGYVDNSTELLPVGFLEDGKNQLRMQREQPSNATALRVGIGAFWGIAAASAATSIVFGVRASQDAEAFQATDLERGAAEAASDFERNRSIAIVSGTVAIVSAATAGLLMWLYRRSSGPVASDETP
jgi:hypothetical protein